MVVQPKTIAGIVPGLQAVSLLAYNLPDKNAFRMKPRKRLGLQTKNIVRKGVGTMVGVGLLKPTSQMIDAL